MSVDAFVIQYKMEPAEFRQGFLGSPDFTIDNLKNLCRDLGLPVSGKKGDLAFRSSNKIEVLHQNVIQPNIMRHSVDLEQTQAQLDRAIEVVVQNLIARERDWVAFKTCDTFQRFNGRSPSELVESEGSQEWYGPISDSRDDLAIWYIRPVHILHWIRPDGSSEPVQALVRWLCLARFRQGILSLHWRGFTHTDEVEQVESYSRQFRYWDYVPRLFLEIETLAGARVRDMNLHDQVLHAMWDKYRYDEHYVWKDRRIRAESGGVVLSAHSGAVAEIGEEQIGGIRHLAQMIRESVQFELRTVFSRDLPEADRFDEVILRALIREFGTLSYEFSLMQTGGDKLLRGHFYFGLRPERRSQDIFPHIRFFTSWRSIADQIDFLVDNLGAPLEHQLAQLSMFTR